MGCFTSATRTSYFGVLPKPPFPITTCTVCEERRRSEWRASSASGLRSKVPAGLLNIDGNLFNKLDLWLDVRNGLPFASNSADSIYSTHMFEHFYPDELQLLLRECLRVLKPGGGIRLIVPNLASAIFAYSRNQIAWFDDSFPRHFDRSAVASRICFLRWTAPNRVRLHLYG